MIHTYTLRCEKCKKTIDHNEGDIPYDKFYRKLSFYEFFKKGFAFQDCSKCKQMTKTVLVSFDSNPEIKK